MNPELYVGVCYVDFDFQLNLIVLMTFSVASMSLFVEHDTRNPTARKARFSLVLAL